MNQKMLNDPNYQELHNSDNYSIGHVFEDIYLIDKVEGKTVNIGSMYGTPTCALISTDDKWCIVGGAGMLLWKKNTVTTIKDDHLYWACRFRQTDRDKVQILIDPWTDNSSIWEFNIQTMERKKIRDFDSYRDKPYTENIEW